MNGPTVALLAVGIFLGLAIAADAIANIKIIRALEQENNDKDHTERKWHL